MTSIGYFMNDKWEINEKVYSLPNPTLYSDTSCHRFLRLSLFNKLQQRVLTRTSEKLSLPVPERKRKVALR